MFTILCKTTETSSSQSRQPHDTSHVRRKLSCPSHAFAKLSPNPNRCVSHIASLTLVHPPQHPHFAHRTKLAPQEMILYEFLIPLHPIFDRMTLIVVSKGAGGLAVRREGALVQISLFTGRGEFHLYTQYLNLETRVRFSPCPIFFCMPCSSSVLFSWLSVCSVPSVFCKESFPLLRGFCFLHAAFVLPYHFLRSDSVTEGAFDLLQSTYAVSICHHVTSTAF